MSSTQTTPEVTWAQRSSSTTASKNIIYLTIVAPDVPKSKLKLDIKPTSLTFSGHSESKKTDYHVQLDFFDEIDPEESKVNHSDRDVELLLRKKELKEEYWPRLTKEKAKLHFLKTNFDKWVDEDEQDAVPEDDPMAQFGGGMPGMDGGDGGFGGIDFSKLGAGGDMPDLSGMAGGLGGGDESDDDMPDLEDEDKDDAEEVPAGKPKIEEVA